MIETRHSSQVFPVPGKDDFSLCGSKCHPPVSWKHLLSVHFRQSESKKHNFSPFYGFPKIPLVSCFFLSWGRRQQRSCHGDAISVPSPVNTAVLCYTLGPSVPLGGDPIQLEVSFVFAKWGNMW